MDSGHYVGHSHTGHIKNSIVFVSQYLKKTNPKDIFFRYFPAASVDYCFDLWHKHQFYFKIPQKRATKLGDYRYDPRTKLHTITVNADLNAFSFLVTYLHEVAHLLVQKKYGSKVDPHGIEWKNEFVSVAKPMLNTQVFPSVVLTALKQYFQNPKASSCSDHNLQRALQWFDDNSTSDDSPSMPYLSDLQVGKRFRFRDRDFIKEETRRTRILCKEIASGKKYLISALAKVQPV